MTIKRSICNPKNSRSTLSIQQDSSNPRNKEGSPGSPSLKNEKVEKLKLDCRTVVEVQKSPDDAEIVGVEHMIQWPARQRGFGIEGGLEPAPDAGIDHLPDALERFCHIFGKPPGQYLLAVTQNKNTTISRMVGSVPFSTSRA